jgi:5-methylcytosine-specific restriction endonuclease McrA
MEIINKLIDKNKKIKKKRKNKKNYNKNNDKKTKTNITSKLDSQNIHNIIHKETIPKRIRELVWTTNNGETFTHKCFVTWCNNNINVFNFQVGHDIPESKGGTIDIDNLKPICGNCNLSMGNRYTITEWCVLIKNNNENQNKLIEHELIEHEIIHHDIIENNYFL